MSMIKLTYELTESAQRAAILAGAPAHKSRTVDVEATRERLAHTVVHADGTAMVLLRDCTGQRISVEASTYDADPAALLDAAISARNDHAARVEAAAAEALAEWERRVAITHAYVTGPGRDASNSGGLPSDGLTRHPLYSELDRNPPRGTRSDRISAETRLQLTAIGDWESAAQQRRAAAEETAKLAKQEAAEREASARAAERDAWVRTHGSERLRKCLDLGMIETCAGVYRDERMALDYPGWQVDSKATHDESEIRNPSLEALAALEEARKIDQSAILVKVSRARDEDEDGSDIVWHEAVKLDDLPGITSSKVFYRLI